MTRSRWARHAAMVALRRFRRQLQTHDEFAGTQCRQCELGTLLYQRADATGVVGHGSLARSRLQKRPGQVTWRCRARVRREFSLWQRRCSVFRLHVYPRVPQPQLETRLAQPDLHDGILRSDGAADERLRLEPLRDDLGSQQGRLRADHGGVAGEYRFRRSAQLHGRGVLRGLR